MSSKIGEEAAWIKVEKKRYVRKRFAKNLKPIVRFNASSSNFFNNISGYLIMNGCAKDVEIVPFEQRRGWAATLGGSKIPKDNKKYCSDFLVLSCDLGAFILEGVMNLGDTP